MQVRQCWMVCYDITNDRTRRRVEKTLQPHGERTQYSVFECWFTHDALRQLLAGLAGELDPKTDSLRAYPLCAWCESRLLWQGPGHHHPDLRVMIL